MVLAWGMDVPQAVVWPGIINSGQLQQRNR